jgi:hypothetical protein
MEEKKYEEYLSRNDIVIEGDTATWSMSMEGAVQGTYFGQFRFRCFLTPSQRLAAGRDHRELIGPNPALVQEHDDNLAFSLSQLKYRIVSAPPFWNSNGIGGDIPDENVIDAVLEAAIAAEFKYLAQIKKKKVDAIEKAKLAAEKMLKLRDEDEGKTQAVND